MKYVYIGESFKNRANIEHMEKFNEFITSNKYKLIEFEDLEIFMKLNRKDLIILSNDIYSKELSIICESKIHRVIKLITFDRDICFNLENKVKDIHLLTDTISGYVEYWVEPLTLFKNILYYQEKNIDVIKYDIVTSFMQVQEYVKDEEGHIRLLIKSINVKDGYKMIKKEIGKIIKEAKEIVKNSKKQIKQETKIAIKIESIINKQKISGKDLISTCVRLKYLPKKNELPDNITDKELVEYLKDNKLVSNEQIINLLSLWYDTRVLNADQLENFVHVDKVVSTKLKEQGVIELYKRNDNEFKDLYILLPYDKREVIDIVNSNISYSEILLTIPEYIDRVILNEPIRAI